MGKWAELPAQAATGRTLPAQLTTKSKALLKRAEAAARVADERKALDVQRVRAELENKLHSGESQREDLNRRVEDYFREITQLREHNQE